jgi:hypothetical protein
MGPAAGLEAELGTAGHQGHFRLMVATGIACVLLALCGGAAIFYQAAHEEDLNDLHYAAEVSAANLARAMQGREAGLRAFPADSSALFGGPVPMRGIDEVAVCRQGPWRPGNHPAQKERQYRANFRAFGCASSDGPCARDDW